MFHHAATVPFRKVNFNLGGDGEGEPRWIDGSGSAEKKVSRKQIKGCFKRLGASE